MINDTNSIHIVKTIGVGQVPRSYNIVRSDMSDDGFLRQCRWSPEGGFIVVAGISAGAANMPLPQRTRLAFSRRERFSHDAPYAVLRRWRGLFALYARICVIDEDIIKNQKDSADVRSYKIYA